MVVSAQWNQKLANIGDWLCRHQQAIRVTQWGIIIFYAVMLIVPAFHPLPAQTAHIWDNVTLFAQFIFWGIWWPGVLVSVILFGRLWCGLFCPEGALSEMASRRGKGKAIPRWIRWPGWPFTAFILTTVYGQMVSVYQYPGPALLILGGSTVAAIAIGYMYGRNHRVWCRYLCPVSGVFGLLAKLSLVHYKVDHQQWNAHAPMDGRTKQVICAPMVPLKTMESASPCHMCGRCAGFRNAIELQSRSPGSEIIKTSAKAAHKWDSLLIITGLIGVAVGAFHWASSPWFITLKQWLATIFVNNGFLWPLEQTLSWWALTNYPTENDVLTVLDGIVLLTYITSTTLIMSLSVGMPMLFAARMLKPENIWKVFHHLTHGLIPAAACGIILGLTAQTVTLLRAEGLPLLQINDLRAGLLILSALWSVGLLWKITGQYRHGTHRVAAISAATIGVIVSLSPWLLLFWIW